ncbi:hypothetical protein L1987_65177 [Smallanthus sonchifolius]|uniref:Uncharacterized protein n=1 Tax=Smallanthus sonchifolius TaxID=185202 RepID=A0ACB9BTP7_9ASTR|nr:hypothetical protein L1987_65177 [Smallanthus sonchifolius]
MSHIRGKGEGNDSDMGKAEGNVANLNGIEAMVALGKKQGDNEMLGFNEDVFKRMMNLRLLDIEGKFTSCEPKVLPDELRWLCWYEYPFSSLPLEGMLKLVGLEMESGKIEYLWKGKKNLKFIQLYNMDFLTRFLDVSGAPNIESLIVSGCTKLVEVDESLASLKGLVRLDMSGCENLKCLPPRIELKSLEILILSYCESLESFPELSECMVNLSHIDLCYCEGIEELPSSIKYASNLSYLNLDSCTRLEKIPNSICELKRLKILRLNQCSKLQKLPDDFKSMDKSQLATNRRPRLPKNLYGFSSLEELCLSSNSKVIQLPASISHLSGLKHLDLNYCRQLRNLQGFPSKIQVVNASNCISLEMIEDVSQEYEWMHKMWLFGCQKLLKDEDNERYLDNIFKESFLRWDDHYLSYRKLSLADILSLKTMPLYSLGSRFISIPGSKIPSWFKEQLYGGEIVLKLPSNWQNQIMGFAVCGVLRHSKQNIFPLIRFRFENDGMFVPKSEVDWTKASAAAEYEDEDTWIGYIPFRLFKQMHEDDDDDDDEFQGEYWSHIVEGNLVIHLDTIGGPAVRCGAQVVYKEDVESIKSVKPYISSYWNWKLKHWFQNTFRCE